MAKHLPRASFVSGSCFLVLAAGLLGRAPEARAKAYTLGELMDLANKGNPGLGAGAQATAGIQAQLLEAERSWFPSGEILGLVTAAPDLKCQTDLATPANRTDKSWREEHCDRTNYADRTAIYHLSGVFARTELRLTQPVFTFGKISAGIAAAEAGVAASRSREMGLKADLELNVRKAYWGMKLAREVLDALNEGIGYLDSGQKQIEKDLTAGTGTVTPVDRYRLRVARALAEAQVLETRRLGNTARIGLRALIGPSAPADIEVDAEPLEAINVPVRPLGHYEEQARLSRPEVKALEHMLSAKRSLADFERRKQYPDVVILGSATFAYASSVDNPKNGFANDPFNTVSAGLAAALRMPLDLGVKNARAARIFAEAEEAAYRRREALGGIAYEVEKAYGELTEALERSQVARQGEKAGKAWITSVSQNFAVGLAEPKDFSDALLAFFQSRIRYLQSLMDVNVAAASLSRATGAEVAAAGSN